MICGEAYGIIAVRSVGLSDSTGIQRSYGAETLILVKIITYDLHSLDALQDLVLLENKP